MKKSTVLGLISTFAVTSMLAMSSNIFAGDDEAIEMKMLTTTSSASQSTSANGIIPFELNPSINLYSTPVWGLKKGTKITIENRSQSMDPIDIGFSGSGTLKYNKTKRIAALDPQFDQKKQKYSTTITIPKSGNYWLAISNPSTVKGTVSGTITIK